jgi:hypothetical protein
MACCIVAALIFAHIMATLRRWAVFWGLARPYEGEDADTIFRRIRQWLARPGVRLAVTALIALEIGAFGSWVYFAHGTHLYRLADQSVGAMRGQTIIYAGVCDRSGADRMTRIVFEDGRVAARRDLGIIKDSAIKAVPGIL